MRRISLSVVVFIMTISSNPAFGESLNYPNCTHTSYPMFVNQSALQEFRLQLSAPVTGKTMHGVFELSRPDCIVDSHTDASPVNTSYARDWLDKPKILIESFLSSVTAMHSLNYIDQVA